MNRTVLAIVVLVLATLACNVTPTEPRELNLYPTATPNATQTPLVVEITTTPNATQTPNVVIVSATPDATMMCVNALVAVHLRPSASNDNYPVAVLPNGAEVKDLGGHTGKWLFVQYADKQGWVYGDYVGDCQ